MTRCDGSPAERFLEAYLQGTLPEDEAQKFEEHYFDCSICLAQVEAMQAVAKKLAAEPRAPQKKPIQWPSRIVIRFAALGAIAAMLLVGFVVLRFKSESKPADVASVPAAPVAPASVATAQTPAPSLAASSLSRLADLTLPAFQGANLRGQSRNPHFDAGMKAYSSQEYERAVKQLSQVPKQDEDALGAKFYTGVCQMQLKEYPEAKAALRSVADAGDSPEQEAALYYLAQTALLSDNPDEARRALQRTIALNGDFKARSKTQLAALGKVEGRK